MSKPPPRSARSRPVTNLDPVVAEYATWMRSWAASDQTIRARTTFVTTRMRDWGLDGFTPANIQDLLADPGWSRWTKATYHAHLKSFCEFLTTAGAGSSVRPPSGSPPGSPRW